MNEGITYDSAQPKDFLVTVDLRKSYISGHEELHVLRGVDISVSKGDIISIVGASGTGKQHS